MKKLILHGLLAACGIGLLAGQAHALRDLSLKQQGELPRDQYLNLVDPAKVNVKQLKVKFVEETRIRLRGERLVSLEGRSLSGFDAFMQRHPELKLERPWTLSEEDLDAYASRGERLSGQDLADLNNWYTLVVTTANPQPAKLLEELLELELVQTCLYHPIVDLPACNADVAPATPLWETSQDYREAAPTGVDIEYAWAHNPTYGNGISTYWVQDVEQGWCVAHEDMNDNLTIYGYDAGNSTDHGSAVISIVAACDNGFGMTGLVPDIRMTARNWGATNGGTYPDVSDALVNTGNSLVLGETYMIEIHAQGPSQGTTCTCNCDQFRYIAMEYWSDNFDAIQTNSANGRFCVEAAGNGSMDLDWAGYGGAFNIGVRDSGAIIVGAGTSAVPHEPTCWTNHGSRIDVYGWGENVYAHGYGYLWSQAGCTQDYTNSFGGTSSATPIVTGAAVSLALIHFNQDGSYPSPATLRTRLRTNGTAQGPGDLAREINVLPNMKGILAPDLEYRLPGGWADYIVPSDVTGTTVLPANLLPSPASTYIDWSWWNKSRYGTANPAYSRIYRDDVNQTTWSAGLGPWTATSVNDVSISVRGGLHYLRQLVDPDDTVDESVETNNSVVIGYRWEPTALAANLPQSFTRGPKRNPIGYTFAALDGYGNGGGFPGYWDVTAVMPASGADYDIQLFNADPTPTTGWTGSVASSGYVSETDFVGCNNNSTTDGDWVGVINWADSSEGYTVERDGSAYLSSPPAMPTQVGSFSLASGEILDVWEMNCTAGSPVWFNFNVTAGTADLAVFVYGPTSTYISRGSALWTLNSGGAGASETGIFTPATSGFHGIVVCKSVRQDLDEYADFNFYWGTPTGDVTTVARSGWTAPVVARNSGGTAGVLPAILNEGSSVGDAGVANIGLGTVPAGINLAFYVDGPFVYSSGDFIALSPGYEGEISNRAIGTIKGGRHELGARQDYLNEVGEELPNGETNNGFFTQYVWAPYSLAANTPVSRSPAPSWSNFDNPGHWGQPGYNQDGYRYTTSYWTGVAVIPANVTMQLNVQGYDYASTHPTTALLDPVSFDYDAPGRVSLVMTNGNVVGNGVALNAGVHNNWAWPGVVPTGNYTVQVSPWHSDMSVGYVQTGTLAGNATTGGEILHTFDISLVAGTSYPITLFNNSTRDLGVAIFSAGLDYVAKNNALAEFNAPGNGVDEIGFFTPTTTGWHGVAVYRSGSADLGPALDYSLVIGAWQPAQPLILSITPVDFSPGNATVQVEVTPVTTDTNGNPLTVDHYNIYYDDNGYLSSPDVVPTTDTSLTLFFGNVGMLGKAFLRITAVDNNGVLVADSDPGTPLPDLSRVTQGDRRILGTATSTTGNPIR